MQTTSAPSKGSTALRAVSAPTRRCSADHHQRELQAALRRVAYRIELPVDRLRDGEQLRALHFCGDHIGQAIVDPREGGHVILRLEAKRRLLVVSTGPGIEREAVA